MNNYEHNMIVGKIAEIFRSFEEVVAIGLTGSRASGNMDLYSDFDFVVMAKGDIPDDKYRKHHYKNHGIADFPYFNVKWEVSLEDGMTIDGMRCECIWMSVPFIKIFLDSLNTNFDCDEFLPGGLLNTTSLYDPDGLINSLKSKVPLYSGERSMHRVKKHLNRAYFSIYVLGWFDKAASRNDYFSFFRHKRDLIDDFITCIFALNKRWFSDEKRIFEIFETFELIPPDVSNRLASVIMNSGENIDLIKCLKNIKSLFEEVASIATKKYRISDFPMEWK